MTDRNDGGAAFPMAGYDGNDSGEKGMRLRDWFAGQVMAYCVRQGRGAELAYQLADEMLVQRDRLAEGEGTGDND